MVGGGPFQEATSLLPAELLKRMAEGSEGSARPGCCPRSQRVKLRSAPPCFFSKLSLVQSGSFDDFEGGH